MCCLLGDAHLRGAATDQQRKTGKVRRKSHTKLLATEPEDQKRYPKYLSYDTVLNRSQVDRRSFVKK
jgi:hypothetical protein